jgi:hypothetical protein
MDVARMARKSTTARQASEHAPFELRNDARAHVRVLTQQHRASRMEVPFLAIGRSAAIRIAICHASKA